MLLAEAGPGVALSAVSTMYPCALEVVTGESSRENVACTTYGFVLRERATLTSAHAKCELPPGAAFAVPGPFEIATPGLVVLVTRIGFTGLFTVTAIEEEGRLAYIDGCSDTVLVAPPRLGDPVLNHLHFPAGITQTTHRHPSVRLGVVARGSGSAYGKGWERPLAQGSVFLLHAHELHAFRTTDESMDVVAFHPDSDWGPTDAAHPMRNRTYT